MIFDWFFAALIFALIGAAVFGVVLQIIGMLAFLGGGGAQPTERTIRIRTHAYDYDEDN